MLGCTQLDELKCEAFLDVIGIKMATYISSLSGVGTVSCDDSWFWLISLCLDAKVTPMGKV